MRKKRSIKHILKVAGFTVIELIVVIAIIAVVSTLVLFNSGKLNSALLLSNTAYEVGLIVREAQIAGLGVRATNNSGDQNFNFSQGVHFDMSNPSEVILFADKDGNGSYNGSIENIQSYTIPNSRGGKILALCAITYSYDSHSVCTPNATDYTPVLDVLFTRPNPEAFFKAAGPSPLSDGTYIMSNHNNSVVINIGFENDICRTIVIRKTGAVQVDTSYCAPASN